MNGIKAVVQKVIPEGKHGPFVVSTSDQIFGSVTFSLEPTVWKESGWPTKGEVVFLGELRLKRAGWRAKLGRFWKLSDEQEKQPERSSKMHFLYPESLQYPFDLVCGQIVLELEKRNWKVPGIEVDFYDYGSGDQKFRCVNHVNGDNFKLAYGRPQGTLPGGRWNDTAAISHIVIPEKEIYVFEDESGPTYFLYAGKNYEQDRERFMSGGKVNSKLNGEPKWYLRYKGGCNCGSSWNASFEAIDFLTAVLTKDQETLARLHHAHRGRRPPLLVHDNDLNREYEPEGNEPRVLVTAEVMEEFRLYLEENVLKMIQAQPRAEKWIDILTEPDPIPFPESVGPLFCFGEYRDFERIRQGKKDPSQLQAADRYALSGGGYRLASLGTPNDGTVPKVAYDGFQWCGIGKVTAETPIDSLDIPGRHRWSDRERFVLRVIPNRADGVYIADHAQYEMRRIELEEAMEKGRDRFLDSEVADFVRARARTIVPIHEYKGGFEIPVVLINRELSFDEVEVVSGPHKDCFGR